MYQAVKASENPSTSYVLSVSLYAVESTTAVRTRWAEWRVTRMSFVFFAVCIIDHTVLRTYLLYYCLPGTRYLYVYHSVYSLV